MTSFRPTLLNGCRLAATAAEARFRINVPAPPARATRVVALDQVAVAVVGRAAQRAWQGAVFYAYEPGTPAGTATGGRRRSFCARPTARGRGSARRSRART
ncbi:MAG TPA: hypothetical protein VGC06_07680 [Actinomycetes bacterium]